MEQRIGRNGPTVSALGLGCMGMSDLYGAADRSESIATIRAALDAGITLLDTGDYYAMGHNEMLIAGGAARGSARPLLLSVKFGPCATRRQLDRDGPQATGDPELPGLLAAAARHRLHRHLPARSARPERPDRGRGGRAGRVGRGGYARHIGLSEVGADTLRRAAVVHAISDLQIEYSLVSRGIEAAILPAARELGIDITAYGVLSRGLIGGHWKPGAEAGEFRAILPRFQGANAEANLRLVEALRQVAEARGLTVAQAAIAGVAVQAPDIVPLVGARRATGWRRRCPQ